MKHPALKTVTKNMSVTEENKAISYAGYESEEKSSSKGK